MVSLGRPRVSATKSVPSSSARSGLKINISRLRSATSNHPTKGPCEGSTSATTAAPSASTPRTPRSARSSTPGSARRTPRGGRSNVRPDDARPSVCPEEILKDEDDDVSTAERSWMRSSSMFREDLKKIVDMSRKRTFDATQAFAQLSGLIGSLQVECSEERGGSHSPPQCDSQTNANSAGEVVDDDQTTEIRMEDDL